MALDRGSSHEPGGRARSEHDRLQLSGHYKKKAGGGKRGTLPCQGQCLAVGMSFSERKKNLFAGHLFSNFLSSRA